METALPSAEAAHPFEGAFRQPGVPRPSMRLLRRSSLHVTEYRSDDRNLAVTATLPRDDAYVVALHLRDRPRGVMAAEGRWMETSNFRAGNAGIVDLRMKLESEHAGAFHFLAFYLTREALDAVADDVESPRVGDLKYQLGVGFSDPVVRHLLEALRPALASPDSETSALYADHVARAFVLHMASTYGGLREHRAVPQGGLAPWQQRRAKELIDARLDGALSLADLARSCQLSIRHFTRAFRQSTGMSAHRWLTERRLERARSLLERSEDPLRDIAAACGYATQSHFTRVFTRAKGIGPGAWRRLHRSRG
jgi:AraC-like DNA-binding protein